MLKNFCIIIAIIFYLQTKALAADEMDFDVEEWNSSTFNGSNTACEDFSVQACGNYHVRSAEDNEKVIELTINTLLDKYDQQENQITEHCQSFVVMLKKYYESCRKIKYRNLTKYLEVIKPGAELNWPIFEEVNNDSNQTSQWPHNKDFDLFSLLGKLEAYGLHSPFVFLSVNSFTAEKNITIRPITFDGNTTFPTKNNIVATMGRIGIKDPAKFISEIKAVDNKFLTVLQNTNKSNNETLVTTVANLEKMYSNLNFKSYFNESLGKQLPLDTIIFVKNPPFFKYLNDNLWLDFEKKQLCNFIAIKFLILSFPNVNVNEITCIEDLLYRFDLAVKFLFYHHVIVPKLDIQEIFESVVDMLKKHFKSNALKLTGSQIEYLVKKLKSFHLQIEGLPENITCEKVKEFYDSVPPLDENNFYKNHLIMLRCFRHLDYMESEPYHIPDLKFKTKYKQKRINLSFAQLMPQLLDYKSTNLSKYSHMGYFIASKLILYCNLMDLSKNTGEVSKPLENYLDCLRINNISVVLYMPDYMANEAVRKIVTLKFFNLKSVQSVTSWKKYFYLAVAQNFCKPPKRNPYIKNEMESLLLNRIAKNSEAFSEIFNCPIGSKMNPNNQKCKIF